MEEYVVVSDEGVLEDGFWSLAEAQLAAAAYGPECDVDLRSNYDENLEWIEESDEEEDE